MSTRPDNMAEAIAMANTPRVCWYTSSSGAIELAIAFDDAAYGYHSGQCDADIAELVQVPYIAEQLATIRPEVAREVAAEAGRNDYGNGPEDMNDHAANLRYVLWMACGDIIEGDKS